MDTPISIRPYQETDLETCRALWRELTQRHRDIYNDQTIGGHDPGLAFDDYLQRSHVVNVWVAEQEGHVVGLTGMLRQGDEAEVEPVVVSACCRSQGIGKLLVEHVVGEAQARGVRFLSVRPVARNVEAIRFFIEAGFKLVGQVELFLDLVPDSSREWCESITLHGHTLRY